MSTADAPAGRLCRAVTAFDLWDGGMRAFR